MRKIVSIVLKVVAGLSLYAVMAAGFAEAASLAMKLGLLAIFSIPALIALPVDMSLTRFRQWKWDLGIVSLVSSAFTIFCVGLITFAVLTRPEVQTKFKFDTPEKEMQLIMGITLMLLFSVLGGVLVMMHWSEGKGER